MTNQKLIFIINIIICLLFATMTMLVSMLLPEPEPPPESIEELFNDNWAFFLINNENPLSEDYEVELKHVSENYSLDIRCADFAIEMLESMKADGLKPVVISAYRSRQKQGENFSNYVDRLLRESYDESEAIAITASQIAMPGASEHNAGLALDILCEGWFLTHDDITEEFEFTPEFEWLSENSWKFGFILRYPKDKENITGFIYEPWHYRFVGLEYAEQIYNSGYTLEEYIIRYPNQT